MTADADPAGRAEVETERCLLRSWTPADETRVLDIYSRWAVAKWLGSTPQPIEDRAEAGRLVARWDELNRSEPVARRWAVERRDDGLLLGAVILVPLPDGDGEFEVGWHFHPDAWGHGYATEAARAAISWGFARGLDEIWAVVRPDNTPSLAVCARAGMTPRGRTTRYYGTELELFHVPRPDRG